MPWLRRPLLIGACAVGALALVVPIADRTAALAYRRGRPALEQNLSRVLGQPIQLGDYVGLRPWGLAVGPSRILARGESRSSLSSSGLGVAVDPWASLRAGQLNLQLKLYGTRAQLRANNRGQYWVLGRRRTVQPPPRLSLRLLLPQPAVLHLANSNSRWRLGGVLDLQLAQRSLELRSQLEPVRAPRGSGLGIGVKGDWGRRQWLLRFDLARLALADLAQLAPRPALLRLPGRANGSVTLSLNNGAPQCQGQLQLEPLRWPAAAKGQAALNLGTTTLRCQKQSLELQPTSVRWGRWQATARGRSRWQPGTGLVIEALELRRGRSWMRGRGVITSQLAFDSRWQLLPADLPGGRRLPSWLQLAALQGRVRASGPWRTPQLTAELSGRQNPLLGPWQAALRWQQGVLQLQELRGEHVLLRGNMPLALQRGQGLRAGPLHLDLHLQGYRLQRLQPLLHAKVGGLLQAQGTIAGPLNRLVPNLSLQLDGLLAGPLRLNERWQGRWQGQPGGGGGLNMQALAPAPPATLTASFNRRWLPSRMRLQRGSGELSLVGSPRTYRWIGRALLLDGLQVNLARPGVQTLQGQLSGSGTLSLQPLRLTGDVRLEQPALLGLRLRQLLLSGRYSNRRYSLQAALQPLGIGTVTATAQGRWGGAVALSAMARGLGADSLRQLAAAWPLWRGAGQPPYGRASDLGTLFIDTVGQSLQQQLEALSRARAELSRRPRQQPLTNLEAQLDVDLTLKGPDLKRAQIDLAGKGHLWSRDASSDRALAQEPLVVRLQGPLQQGSGSFSLQNLPLSLLALLTPVPQDLRGSLALQGQYGIGRRQRQFSLSLSSQDAYWGSTPLQLKRGSIVLKGQALNVDLALQAANAQSSVDLAGIVPLDPTSRTLELRLASRGDGLSFLTAFVEPDIDWQQGTADLQLLLRGSVSDPIANGFLRIQNGRLQMLKQTVKDLEATILFDFEQLLVQQLKATVAQRGQINARGHLGLMDPVNSGAPLTVDLQEVPFSRPRIQAVANGQVVIRGSLRQMRMGGEVAFNRGTINAQPGRLVPLKPGRAAQLPRKGVSQLLQENWDFQNPLLLIGNEVETNSSQRVLQSVPRFAALGFDDFRLKLGPDMRIVIPNAASFKTVGLLRLSGRLDPTLRARGVLRLLQGRLNLFTTTFSLDPEAPNVAIFTPALGLIPYLDIAMRTRVSDNVATSGLGRAGTPSLAEIEAQGGLTSLNQLNLVRITVSVEGPADRLARSIRLRSSPPLPESRLIALIGGNTLAGLSGSGAGAAIATVVGQTLLSPVLGGLSDAFGQRLSFALYPTYLNPNVANTAVLQSQRLAPQLVLGSEIGVDITDRINASVLTAPNRSDVPPQLNLNVRATDLINIQGSVDTQGAWQTQMQLFFRF